MAPVQTGDQLELRLRKSNRSHVALLKRPTEISYDARVAKLVGKKLDRKKTTEVLLTSQRLSFQPDCRQTHVVVILIHPSSSQGQSREFAGEARERLDRLKAALPSPTENT
jgi:hypothetical protein